MSKEWLLGNKHAVGNPPNKTSFKTGHKSWLKGTKGVVKPNSGSFKKGQVSLNKGKKMPEHVKEKLRQANIGRTSYWRGKNLQESAKKKIGNANRGPKSYRWKGGITKKNGYQRSWHENKRTKIAGRPRPNQCELCGAFGRIVFDHDHATGKFRGWICYRCNFVLGLVKDRTETLDLLKEYLLKHNG